MGNKWEKNINRKLLCTPFNVIWVIRKSTAVGHNNIMLCIYGYTWIYKTLKSNKSVSRLKWIYVYIYQ